MKYFFSFLLAALFFIGCSSFKVEVKEDPFKGTKFVTVDMWHKVIDQKSLVFDNQRFLYEKEIKNGKVLNPTAYFLFNLLVISLWGYNGEDFEKTAYILCDNNKFKANIIDYSKVERTNVSGKAKTNINWVSGETSAKSEIGTSHVCTVSGKIVLTPDIQKAISNCSTYMIRFYLAKNNVPVTLQATNSQLDAVKRFISVDDSKQKEEK